ncbi:hypothetical protein WN943_009964 [Citrus x changshan-huyou]
MGVHDEEAGSKDDSNEEPFGPWMIATKRGRKPYSGKEITGGSHRNREFARTDISRFQILDQVSDEYENHGHAACTDLPSTSRQPFIPTSNPIFTSNPGNSVKTLARRKPHNKAVAAKPQSGTPKALATSTVSPFQPSAFNTREEVITPLPHANQNPKLNTFPQPAYNNQTVIPIETTLDPTKHTVVFCSS